MLKHKFLVEKINAAELKIYDEGNSLLNYFVITP